MGFFQALIRTHTNTHVIHADTQLHVNIYVNYRIDTMRYIA